MPSLQLDVAGGSYDAVNEDILPGGSPFDLAMLLVEDADTKLNSTFCLSIAIVSLEGTGYDGITAGDLGWGSFDIGATTYSPVSAGAIYGTPPPATEDLPTHGVFDTRYFELAIDFTAYDALADSSYNSQTGNHTYPLPSGDQDMYVKFLDDIDVSGLTDGYAVHFDLYQKDGEGNVIEKAPFSHDATSIPEPAGFVLALAGMAVFGLIRRKRK
ncbi:hypothetical protein HQ590_12445 [bacterium]|nr:hypothetical protein [bacterium]